MKVLCKRKHMFKNQIANFSSETGIKFMKSV